MNYKYKIHKSISAGAYARDGDNISRAEVIQYLSGIYDNASTIESIIRFAEHNEGEIITLFFKITVNK